MFEEDDAVSLVAGRGERNASVCPSGLQRGEVEDCALVVNWRGGELWFVAAIQIFNTRRFCFWSIVATT